MAEHREPWYMATVADNADPDKRRRLRLRGPDESEEAVPTDALPWINAFPRSRNDFFVPDVGDTVLVINNLGKLQLWTELPDKTKYQLNDYANAFFEAHKDAFSRKYDDSEWTILYKGNLHETFDNDTIDITQGSVKLETNSSGTLKLTVNDVVIETDGSKVHIANGSKNLFTILDQLMTTLETQTFMAPSGPTSVAMPPFMSQLKQQHADFKELLY